MSLSTTEPKEYQRWTKTFFDPKLIPCMQVELIGPHPLMADKKGASPPHIGTVFPEFGVLYTQPPGVHAWQRQGFIDCLNERRAAQSHPPLTPEDEERICVNSVDIIFEPWTQLGLVRVDPTA